MFLIYENNKIIYFLKNKKFLYYLNISKKIFITEEYYL